LADIADIPIADTISVQHYIPAYIEALNNSKVLSVGVEVDENWNFQEL